MPKVTILLCDVCNNTSLKSAEPGWLYIALQHANADVRLESATTDEAYVCSVKCLKQFIKRIREEYGYGAWSPSDETL